MGDFLKEKIIENKYKNDYLDIDGNPVSRIPNIYPTFYSEFVVYKSPDFRKSDIATSNIDLINNNNKAFKFAVHKTWNCKIKKDLFRNKSFEDLQRFLDFYSKGRMKLTAVLQGCNVNDGSPYWIFYYSLNNLNV